MKIERAQFWFKLNFNGVFTHRDAVGVKRRAYMLSKYIVKLRLIGKAWTPG